MVSWPAAGAATCELRERILKDKRCLWMVCRVSPPESGRKDLRYVQSETRTVSHQRTRPLACLLVRERLRWKPPPLAMYRRDLTKSVSRLTCVSRWWKWFATAARHHTGKKDMCLTNRRDSTKSVSESVDLLVSCEEIMSRWWKCFAAAAIILVKDL